MYNVVHNDDKLTLPIKKAFWNLIELTLRLTKTFRNFKEYIINHYRTRYEATGI
jgi:hypothetical protein